MGNFNVASPKAHVRAPGVDGYVVGMTASLVDRRGRRITIRDVMLHHIVFHRIGRSTARWPCSQNGGEAFYGTGEENQRLRLPQGYGYRIRRHDRWRITAMLMSHSVRRVKACVRYVVRGASRRPLEPGP